MSGARAASPGDHRTLEVAPDLDLDEYARRARREGSVDRESLHELLHGLVGVPGPIVLLGYSDDAKHVVNVFGADGAVVAIGDLDGRRAGWTFRGVPVVSVSDAVACAPATFVVTNRRDIVMLTAAVESAPGFSKQRILSFPMPVPGEQYDYYDVWEHSRFYRDLAADHEQTLGLSMLDTSKVQFLVEAARQTLSLPGDWLEVGVWQGGSAFALAELLRTQRSTKRLVLMDLFEEAPRTNPGGIMALSEIEARFASYLGTVFVSGDVRDHTDEIKAGTWSFIHYDAGFKASVLGQCLRRLTNGGVMVLDNYGNLEANPARFDAFFEQRGHQVSRAPTLSQGFVIKHGRGGA